MPFQQNHILSALPDEHRQWAAGLEQVDLPLGRVLHEPGGEQTHVWFPLDGIVSLLYEMRDGDTAEIAIVGCEGLIGVPLYMGGNSAPQTAVVQSQGSALRVKASVLREQIERSGPLQLLFLRYAQALFTQVGQTAVCNRHHSVEQQLCRWLLMSHDRLHGDHLVMTQELIARMLGVRRGGVTEAAGALRRAEAISYLRGRITVTNRAVLERMACECYAVVQAEYQRLLQWDSSTPVMGRAATGSARLKTNGTEPSPAE